MSIQNIRHLYSIGELLPVFLEQLRVRCDHIPRGAAALDGDMTIEALPTWYGGTTFRSKLEADWAATLDSLNIRWEYEPETITLPSGAVYIPDFWLPDIGTWLEVKGTGVPRIEKAIELGETRACRCGGDCTCEWPGGELVIIGHPAAPYDAYSDPELEGATPLILRNASRRHHGHPSWSAAHGRAPWLSRCLSCDRGGWSTDFRCRHCGNGAGGHAYRSGSTELQFINADCKPAPTTATKEAA